jgi:adenine-specific DNA-methyltransferase
MCQASLIHYLDSAVNKGKVPIIPDAPEQKQLFGNSTPKQIQLKTFGRKTIVPKQDIADLVRKGEFAIEHDVAKIQGTKSYKYQVPESIRKHSKILDEKLKNIKVCDPAIGSGAFAVGMMHEIVKARAVLSTYLEDEPERSIYDLKRNCIQQSIYGVDIDPGAIDIAQLRLWLSLVVDEDDYHSIKPLPNLDYKIMQGDSLVEKFHGISLDTTMKKVNTGDIFPQDPDLDRMIEELHRKQNELFSAIRAGDKKRLKREVEKAIVDIFHYELERQKKDYFREIDQVQETASIIPDEGEQRRWIEDEKIKLDEKYGFNPKSLERELQEMTHGNMARNFFPWKLYFADVFRKNGGFDITIANPPYVRQETIKPLKPKLKDEFGEFFCGTSDLYTYFYKRGLEMLKNGGHLCFIAPNKFMRAAYGKNTRELLTTKAAPKLVIDFGDLPIFDATTYPAILLLEKNVPQPEEKATAATFTEKKQIEQVENTLADIGFPMKISALNKQGWNLEPPEVLALMDKLRATGMPLGRKRLFAGIKTGLNKAFVIDMATRKRFIDENPKSKELIKPWLRGRDIKRWKTEWAGLYVIFARRGVNIERYPAIKKYLEQFREDLEPKKSPKQKQGRKPGSYKWYEIQDNIAYYKEFERPKIIVPDLAPNPRFSIEYGKLYPDMTVFVLSGNDNYLLGLLNSTLMSFFFLKISASVRGQTFRFKKFYMEQLPIAFATSTQKAPIIELVEKILSDPDSPDVPFLEKEIDALVYDLYGLTPEEIAIVEGKRKNSQRINYPA